MVKSLDCHSKQQNDNLDPRAIFSFWYGEKEKISFRRPVIKKESPGVEVDKMTLNLSIFLQLSSICNKNADVSKTYMTVNIWVIISNFYVTDIIHTRYRPTQEKLWR